ncbi:hypothetical protein BJ170DRAFT_601477 [Xylariales sp. AK1849]|nr:hypothetical protein BJ170DRAFT_601477 [Xylariales sp. AK1849]
MYTDVFRLERWLYINPGEGQTMRTTLELRIGHGRWRCSGRAVVHMELSKTILGLSLNHHR